MFLILMFISGALFGGYYGMAVGEDEGMLKAGRLVNQWATKAFDEVCPRCIPAVLKLDVQACHHLIADRWQK